MTNIPTFADLLKEYREDAGISQSMLGREAAIDHSHVSRLEAGNRRPMEETIVALAAAMDCDLQDIDRLMVTAGYLPVSRRMRHIIYVLCGLMEVE